MELKTIAEYKNGNAIITLKEDGTREIVTEDDKFNFDFPLSIDCKITNQCFRGCKMCYENSTPDGKHAPLENFEFLNTWSPGTEIALGGGMLTLYPYLDELLYKIKDLGLIANATFHQDELVENFDKIKAYQDQKLIYGIGISYSHEDPRLIKCDKQLKNVVFHTIAGLTKYKDFKYLSDNFANPKLLILGYKVFRRGEKLYEEIHDSIEKQIRILSYNLDWISEHFDVVSFDNLAIKQLKVKDFVDDETWNECYQGDEGTCSMYIDAVKGKFAINSTSKVRYPLQNDIKEMFKVVKEMN